MRIVTFMCCYLGLSTFASGQMTMALFEADGLTPFDFRDIMVGTKLTVIVESGGVSPICAGGLFIAGNPSDPSNDNRLWGLLSGRNRDLGAFVPNCQGNNGSASLEPGDWTGSHLPSAGPSATVYTWNINVQGFDIESDNTAVAGDWFIIDYTATGIKDPNGVASVDIGLYDYDVSLDIPIQTFTVNQVRTRDFNDTGTVDYADFAIVNNNWMATNCQNPDWCDQADLSQDGNVNIVDLDMFIDFWLVGL